MKFALTIALAALTAGSSVAQELPKLSPISKSEHTVGLNKIAIQYSRPSVRDRVIWGELVPFNEVWRLGANEATKFTCSQDIMFGSGTDKVLAAGTYAVFAIPSADRNWTIIFNNDTQQWGTGTYDSAKDALRLQVTAQDNEHTETLLIDVNSITPNSASLIIAWEKIKITLPFTVDTDKAAEANIATAVAEGKDLDKVYNSAANYYFNIKADNAKALEYIDKSIAVKKAHGNVFLKARILYKMGEVKEAKKLANEALKMAEEANEARWVTYISDTIKEWEAEK